MPLKSSVPNTPKSDPAQFASLDADIQEVQQAAAVPEKPAVKPAAPKPQPESSQEKPGGAASIPPQNTAKKPLPEIPEEEVGVLFHTVLRNFRKVLKISFHLFVSKLISPVARGILKLLSIASKGVLWAAAPVKDFLILPVARFVDPYFKSSLNAYIALILALIGSSVVVALLTYNRTYGEVFKLEEKIAWLETERENDALMIDKLTKINNQDIAKIKQNEELLQEKNQKIEALYQDYVNMNARLRELNARLPVNLQSSSHNAAISGERPVPNSNNAVPAKQQTPCTISNSKDIKSAVLDCLQ